VPLHTLIDEGVGCLHCKQPALWHRISRVDGQINDGRFEFVRIDFDTPYASASNSLPAASELGGMNVTAEFFEEIEEQPGPTVRCEGLKGLLSTQEPLSPGKKKAGRTSGPASWTTARWQASYRALQ